MIDPVIFFTFLSAALAVALVPGPEMMFCLGQGLRGGWRAGVLAAAGLVAGPLFGVALAATGLAALTEAAPGALSLLRWFGVGYLLWLAWRSLRDPAAISPDVVTAAKPARSLGGGLLVGVTNPKGAGFVFVLLPQFVDPAGPVLAQYLIFGAILSATGFAVNAAVGGCAGRLAPVLAERPSVGRLIRWLGAGIFGALAARLAFGGRA